MRYLGETAFWLQHMLPFALFMSMKSFWNKEVMYCYYMAIKDKRRGYWKRIYQQWKDRGNIECTEQRLCDQKKQIEDKTLLTPAEIKEVKQQVKSDNFQEKDGQQSEEEQQAVTTILDPVEPEVNPEPEHPIPPTYHETPDNDDDYDYDYDQLKDEYLELLEEVKSQPIKERKKLSKLKNDKKLKGVVRIIDNIIEETSTDNMDLTTTSQMQYTAALLVTNKITPPKPTTNRKPRGGPPAWQQRLQKQIDPTKRRHIHHHWIHQWKHHHQDKEETQDHPQETQDNSRWAAHSLQRGSKAGTTSQSTKTQKIYQKKWAVQTE